MLASPALVETVAEVLAGLDVPVVVDPVGVSKHGDSLLAPDAVEPITVALLPAATVVTPNLWEVEQLTGVKVEDEAGTARGRRGGQGPRPRMGAGQGRSPARRARSTCCSTARASTVFTAPRHDNRHTHGTGCTLASAIASHLALGEDVPDAVGRAKEYVTGAIEHGFPLGAGIGPVDHAWRIS